MYVFVDVNSYTNEIIEELKNQEQKPICLFSLSLETKEKAKQSLIKIRELIKKNTYEKTAVQVSLGKKESWKVGFINQLQQETDLVLGRGGLNVTNRFFLEQTTIDFLINPQSTLEKPKIDYIHHFNMGLNHVLLQFAKEQDKHICLFLDMLPEQHFFKAKELGRIAQIIRLAHKYKTAIHLQYLIKKKEDIRTVFMTKKIMEYLGYTSQHSKQSLEITTQKIKEKEQKRSPEYICEGIMLKK
jgi:RNase P/RNase MRP subunit p30